MPIPDRLRLPEFDEAEVREFCSLCDELELRASENHDCSELLAHWNARANRTFSTIEFTTYAGAVDVVEFVSSSSVQTRCSPR